MKAQRSRLMRAAVGAIGSIVIAASLLTPAFAAGSCQNYGSSFSPSSTCSGNTECKTNAVCGAYNCPTYNCGQANCQTSGCTGNTGCGNTAGITQGNRANAGCGNLTAIMASLRKTDAATIQKWLNGGNFNVSEIKRAVCGKNSKAKAWKAVKKARNARKTVPTTTTPTTGTNTPPTGTNTNPTPTNGGTTTAPQAGVSALEQQMVNLVNGERAKAGVAALKVNVKLTEVARTKAQDMIDHSYFSHTSPTYGSPFDMMKTFGISYRTAGENIAMNQSVGAAHTALMNSPGHRANILNSAYTEIGIGIAKDSNGNIYISQMFIGN
ncbi:MAG: CAP domain-containing protein [Bacillota bacterium]|nr:CAP domain-containing protein [Bacillota bacterium]